MFGHFSTFGNKGLTTVSEISVNMNITYLFKQNENYYDEEDQNRPVEFL